MQITQFQRAAPKYINILQAGMKNTLNHSRRKLQRSNSGKKRRFSPLVVDTDPRKNLRTTLKGGNQRRYGGNIKSANKINNHNNIKNQYAITQSDERVESRERSRKLSKQQKFKEIERRHRNKIEKDIEQQRNHLKKRRSQASLGSATNSSAASMRNRSNNMERKDSQSTQKIQNKKYVTLAIQSQRYIKMSPDQKPVKDVQQISYQQRIQCLVEEIDEYKRKYQKALQAVQKLSKAMQGQNNKYFLEKQIYEQKIRMLKTQLESKNIHKNSGTFGHIYYYKQFPQHKILPESFIMEQKQQSYESNLREEITIYKDTLSRAEKLVQEFNNMPQNSSGIKSNLSIQSK